MASGVVAEHPSDSDSSDAQDAEVFCELAGDEDVEDFDPVEQYFTPDPSEGHVSMRWPIRLQQLLRGSLEGGDPTSSTGLLAGVAPMLLHSATSFHVERPARLVSIYHELFEQELVARAKLVPARPAMTEDLNRVHERRLVRRASAAYESDEAATAALGLDSDTYLSLIHI